MPAGSCNANSVRTWGAGLRWYTCAWCSRRENCPLSLQSRQRVQSTELSQHITNLLWSSVIKVNLVLDIEVCPPMTNLRSASQGLDGQHRESKFIVNRDLLLVLLNESGIRGRREIVERPVRDSASGITLGHNTIRREGDVFGFCVAEDRESNSPRITGKPLATT